MSTDTEQVDVGSSESIVELARRWYHVPALALMMLFMAWVRLRPADRFLQSDQVYFQGNDAYYHFRETMFTVENWPWTMSFEPWTQFPFGSTPDHFGTLFDQIIATLILFVGLGNPSDRLAATVFALAPVLFGVACALPTYYIGKRLGGRTGGLFSVLILALLPGMFLRRSVIGFTDHHIGEVLFQSLAILAMMIAVTVAEREKPVYEQFLDRDWDGLRATLKWSGLAGVALALYLWTWPPGVMLVGILGAFFVVALCVDFLQGRSPEHVAIVGVISLGIAAVFSLVTIDELTITGPATMSLLQPALALVVAVGCAFLAWLGREWERRDQDRILYPATVAGLIGLAALVTYVALPDLFSLVWNQIERTLLIRQSETGLTVQEVQSTLSNGGSAYMLRNYGLTYLFALVGLVWLVIRLADPERYRAEHTLVVVWAIFVTLMALTQVRFHYYLAVVVAVLSAYLLSNVLDLLNFDEISTDDVETYQVLAVVATILVVLVPLAGVGAGMTVVEQAERTGPGDVQTWDGSLDWVNENTPTPGEYGGADSADEFEYYGTFDRTDDYDYPEGVYGVMSWWDYGHWITVEGERVPVANPFQQGAEEASAFFQTDSEQRAELLLDALPAAQEYDGDGQFAEASNDELQSLAGGMSEEQDNEETRYVMIDHAMAGGKFSAITRWTGPPTSEFYTRENFALGGQEESLLTTSDRFHDSMMGELYLDDASGLDHYRLVHENEQYAIVGGQPTRTGGTWTSAQLVAEGWENNADLQQRIAQDRENGEATVLSPNDIFYDAHLESSVKTFERVEGATLTGEAEAGQTVVVAVDLEANTGRPFTYVDTAQAGDDGTFEVTVPYATNEEVGVEDGYTDSGVEAVDDYEIAAGANLTADAYDAENGTFAGDAEIDAAGETTVSETAIYDGEEISVDLSDVEQSAPEESDAGSDSDAADGADDADGDETDGGNETDAEADDANETDADNES